MEVAEKIVRQGSTKSFDAFRHHLTAWRWIGMSPPTNRFRKLYFLIGIICNCAVLVHTIGLICNCIVVRHDLEQFLSCFSIAVTSVFASIKFLNLFLVRNKLVAVRRILHLLESNFGCDFVRNSVAAAVRYSQRVFIICSIFFIVGYTITLMLAVHQSIILHPVYIPGLDLQNSRTNFIIINVVETVAAFYLTMQEILNDSYPAAYLIILQAHVKVISHRISKIGQNLSKTAEQNCDELVHLAKDYLRVIELYKIIEGIISNICLVQFFYTGLIQCTIGIYFFYIGGDVLRVIYMGTVFVGVTMESLTLCYFGQKFLNATEDFKTSIYLCNWVNQNARFKRTLLIVMSRADKSNQIMAGKFAPVTMAMFVSLMKSAYSYFAVLNELKT